MSIVTTRAQRRELERQNAKMPRELRLVPREEWPLEHQRGPILRVWRSRDFLVQEYAEPAPVLVRLSVLRTTLDPKAGRQVSATMLRDRYELARQRAALKAYIANDDDLARQIKAMVLRDMRKRASDLADDASEAQKLLQHGSQATTVRHYRTRAERLKPAR